MQGPLRPGVHAEIPGVRGPPGQHRHHVGRIQSGGPALLGPDGDVLHGVRHGARTVDEQHGAVIDRIDDVVLDLSGMREATPERPSSLDEATAELGKGRSSGSGTA